MKLPILEKYFEGYQVPERYKQIVSCIVRRFDLSGCCDGIYMCNLIANESGTGDGCGNFTGDAVNIKRSALSLFRAYPIDPDDLPELEEILETGELNPKKAIPGLRRYAKKMRAEKPFEKGGRYTEAYITRCVHNAADAHDELSGTLAEGYTPNYYTPGWMPDENKHYNYYK